MNVEWCLEAKRQFLASLKGIPTILQVFLKEEKFFLLSEVVLQWIEDLALYVTSEIPHHSVIQTCRNLGISFTPEEEMFLRRMEKASRKEESYREFVQNHQQREYFFSLIQKIESCQQKFLRQ
ncbi:MAG: hypothetical protein ACK4HQ_08515 [Brevinematales bacterium]